ncbi:ribosomal protein S13 [Columba livia]|uniref:Small ribosomal subunit protein uS15 n=1 Tax=Columba livia TaxID=8932 RepID=A0A2I0MHT9_COLLI|nr:40S ribosomal protein S13 [Columba livia]PKK29250.1 ribosomal protein S13 [Columba livia]
MLENIRAMTFVSQQQRRPGLCRNACPWAGPVLGAVGDESSPSNSFASHCLYISGGPGRLSSASDLLPPHSKGLSQSALPYRRSVPTWLKLTSDDVKEQIYKLAKKGLTPSQIGVILRDSHGVAQVRFVTGNKILRILKSKGLAPDLPEDLYHLIKKAVAVRKHLERNRKDKDAKFRLILIESRIHRLARYYKTKRVLPPNWKYESSTASALVA